MRILNVREGFACNSSSTHSIVFSREAVEDRDADGDFGWNWFRAASHEAKSRWLAATLRSNLHRIGLHKSAADLIVRGACPTLRTRSDDAAEEEGNDYVDHQSEIILPRTWDGIGIDLDFFADLRNWILQPEVAIFGGNDNESREIDAPKGSTQIAYRDILPVDGHAPFVARKDRGGYWTLFNREDGGRVRVAFGEGDLAIEATRAETPELVDLKITDFCPYGCPACYQGSTTAGAHADYGFVQQVMANLSHMRVFEVALGGGEPTLHPHFVDILRDARLGGIVPNFTTKNYRWFLQYPEAVDLVGGFAVSCDNDTEVREFLRLMNAQPAPLRDKLHEKMSVQHVLGLAMQFQVDSIFRQCADAYVPLTLLGFKTTHRGAKVVPQVPSGGLTWADWVLKQIEDPKAQVPRLGVDTVLAAEFAGKVPSWRLTVREGQFSCYIDACAKTAAPSSFSLGAPYAMERPHEDLVKAWQNMSAYQPESAYVYRSRLAVQN